MAKGDVLYSFGRVILHQENNGAAVIVHSWTENEKGGQILNQDHTVEFKWSDLEKAVGGEAATVLNRILLSIGEAARKKCSKLKNAKFGK